MRLKLSFSIINAWYHGDKDGAIDMLMGKWREPTEAMQFGTFMHKQWENEVNETGCLPKVFGGAKIEQPLTETYYKKQILDWLWLSGVIDLQYQTPDGDLVLVDYKTGNGNANQYTQSLQAGIYGILQPDAKLFIFKHYNQYEDKTTSSIIRLGGDVIIETLNVVTEIAYDIVDELIKRGMSDFDNVDKSSRKEQK